jgi:hypothetical protein
VYYHDRVNWWVLPIIRINHWLYSADSLQQTSLYKHWPLPIQWHLILPFSPHFTTKNKVKVKVIPQQAEVAQGVPGRLRPWIFLTFGTTRVVGCQTYTPATFTPAEIPGTHFQGLSQPQGTWLRQGEPRILTPVTPPRINPRTVQLVAQCLNHYATPGTTKNKSHTN